MNIASARLLEDGLQNFANSVQQNRQLAIENSYRQQQLQIEAQREAVDQSFRDAMMQHYANIEEKQAAGIANQEKHADLQDSIAKQQLAKQNLQDANNNMVQSLQYLTTRNDLTDQQRTAQLQKAIDSNPDFKAQIMNNPQISALYNGEPGSWEYARQQVAAQQMQGPPGKIGPTEQQALDWYNANQAAQAETDPQKKAALELKAQALMPDSMRTKSETKYTIPGQDAVPATPPSTTGMLWWKKNIPGTPGTPAVPAKQVVTTQFTGDPGATSAQPTQPTAAMTPPASHIAFLQANPQYAQQFDAKYGPGAAAQYLGQTQQNQQPIPGGGGFPISLPSGQPTGQ